MSSCLRRFCYPWGKFFLVTRGRNYLSRRSLDQPFDPAIHALKITVRLAYAHELESRFPSGMSQSLVTPDIFSDVCRPSQTAHQQLSRMRFGKYTNLG